MRQDQRSAAAGTFVGRNKELAQLDAALSSAATGRGGLWLVAGLAEDPPGDDAGPPTTGQDRFYLFDAVGRTLRTAAVDQLLVVILEDLHAADPPSLRLARPADYLPVVQLRVLGGAIADVPPDAPAYAHRDAPILAFGRHPPRRRRPLGPRGGGRAVCRPSPSRWRCGGPPCA